MHATDLLNWFAGGASPYMTLVHCMNHDTLWIAVTVALDLLIAMGYAIIALHWWKHETLLPDSPAKTALRTMKKIFIFCGLCGYVFIPIKMFWPAWRLYDVFLAVLAFHTWRYALRSRQLRVVYEELGRSAQLEADLARSLEETKRKSYFLRAVSHDLKTPLNGMVLQAELAEMSLDSNEPEAVREALAEIKGCARTAADLLNRLLEIGRLEWSDEPSVCEPVALDALLEHVAGQFRARAEQKGIALVVERAPGLVVDTDRIKLERIVHNLADNAVKFTGEGQVRLAARAEGRAVRIDVEDTGPGIAAGHQAMIFDDFAQVGNRARDSRRGFGLGLAIALRLARQLRGELTVDSAAGRGARFTLVLPAEAPSVRAGERCGPIGQGASSAARQ